MKNPVSYILGKDFTVKTIDRIYDSMRRRARAAFKHQWGHVEKPEVGGFITEKLKKNAEAIEYGLTASWEEARKWANRGVEIVRFGTNVEAERWMRAQKFITDSNRLIKNYEGECFQRVRGQKHIKALTKPKDGARWFDEVKTLLKRLRMAYPYVTSKNQPRLSKALRKHIAPYSPSTGNWDNRFKAGAIRPYHLLEAGIPAAEIAGPWWTRRKDIKSPIEWVRAGKMTNDFSGRMDEASSSPTAKTWLMDAGLDANDRQLVQSVETYYMQHKAAPSVEWARRRNNELEEERTNKDLEDQLPKVEDWLTESDYWRRSADFAEVYIPKMPDPTFRVLGPGDAELLCRTAKRDGLCVVDTITDIVDNGVYVDEERTSKSWYKKSKEEGFVTLIFSTDPKRRTVVGLNELGICTSEHHCTGIQNKVDKLAFEYFKKPEFED